MKDVSDRTITFKLNGSKLNDYQMLSAFLHEQVYPIEPLEIVAMKYVALGIFISPKALAEQPLYGRVPPASLTLPRTSIKYDLRPHPSRKGTSFNLSFSTHYRVVTNESIHPFRPGLKPRLKSSIIEIKPPERRSTRQAAAGPPTGLQDLTSDAEDGVSTSIGSSTTKRKSAQAENIFPRPVNPHEMCVYAGHVCQAFQRMAGFAYDFALPM